MLRLEWNRPRLPNGDVRGLYTQAIRDPERRIHYWINWALGWWEQSLHDYNIARGARWISWRASP